MTLRLGTALALAQGLVANTMVGKLVPLVLQIMLVFFATACLRVPDGLSEGAEHIPVSLGDTWQYRWGNTPFDAEGVPLWLKGEELRSPEWRPLKFPAQPPDRQGRTIVWQRTTLPDKFQNDAVLYVFGVDQAMDVYLDGKLIYRFGDINVQGVGKFSGYPWHMITLPPASPGKMLAFRIWSAHINIGLIGDVQVGPRSAFLYSMLLSSAGTVLVALSITLLGLTAGLMAVARRSQKEYLFFALFTTLGLWLLNRTPVKLFVISDPYVAMVLELLALVVSGSSFPAFVDTIFGPTRFNFSRRVWQIGYLYGIVVIVVAITKVVPFMALFAPYQIYGILFIIPTSFFLVGKAALRGLVEARIVLLGTTLFLATCVVEGAIALGLFLPELSGRATLITWGLLTFALSLAAVLIFRFVAVYRKIARLKARLEKILTGTKIMATTREKLIAAAFAVKNIVTEISISPQTTADLYLRQASESSLEPVYARARLVEEGEIIASPCLKPVENETFSLEAIVGSNRPKLSPSRTILVPIAWGEQKIGCLKLTGYKHETLHDEEEHFIATLVNSLAMAISNIDFLAETKKKTELEAELQAAAAVQEALLPHTTQFPGISMASSYQSASHTGGDWLGYYYDRCNHRLDIFVADVTGHGFPSALLCGVVCGAVYAEEQLLTLAAESCSSNTSVTEHLTRLALVANSVVLQTGRAKLMCTMAFLSLDLASGELWFLNAGHTNPFWFQKCTGTVTQVANGGYRLGSAAKPKFSVKKIALAEGDHLFLYTDGLFENTGPDKRTTFPTRGLRKILATDKQAQLIHDEVLQAAAEVWQDEPFADDVTTLLLKWHGAITRDVVSETARLIPGVVELDRGAALVRAAVPVRA